MENNIEEKILNKIKDENIKPRSVWYFLVRDYSLWILVLISVILASLSIAPIIFILQNLEVGYIKHISTNPFLFILLALPYPWIILCMITTYLATIAWEKTSKGYRFEGKKLFSFSLLVSLLFGLLLNLINFGRIMDDEFRTASFGNYKTFVEKRNTFWFKPDEGRLIGTATNISTSSFQLGNKEQSYNMQVNFDSSLHGSENVNENSIVRVVGYSDPELGFIACAIFPDNFGKVGNGKFKMASSTFSRGVDVSEECKKIFEQGRANFHPKPPRERMK